MFLVFLAGLLPKIYVFWKTTQITVTTSTLIFFFFFTEIREIFATWMLVNHVPVWIYVYIYFWVYRGSTVYDTPNTQVMWKWLSQFKYINAFWSADSTFSTFFLALSRSRPSYSTYNTVGIPFDHYLEFPVKYSKSDAFLFKTLDVEIYSIAFSQFMISVFVCGWMHLRRRENLSERWGKERQRERERQSGALVFTSFLYATLKRLHKRWTAWLYHWW